MHQVNCSVDLDTESLLGFKTIQTNEEGQQEIVFIDGPVIKAMKQGHIYISMKLIWLNQKRFRFLMVS